LAPTKAPIVAQKQQPLHEVPRVIRAYEELKDGKEIADLWLKANMKQADPKAKAKDKTKAK